jgi:hypothetical protein
MGNIDLQLSLRLPPPRKITEGDSGRTVVPNEPPRGKPRGIFSFTFV